MFSPISTFITVVFQETHSPNGSCLSSMQTIHSHPPARWDKYKRSSLPVKNSKIFGVFFLSAPKVKWLREASQKKIQKVNFFLIGLEPPPLPPRNVNFLKSILDFLSSRQKIDLIECKLWGRPPPPFGKSLHFEYFFGTLPLCVNTHFLWSWWINKTI